MIRAQNLTKFFGTVAAVRDISFEIKRGEIVAFLGPNGAGKTTTIKMLTTLLKPTSGKIEVDGLDPASQPNEARKRFGIVFQDPSLDDELTAQENMDMHGALNGADLGRFLRRARNATRRQRGCRSTPPRARRPGGIGAGCPGS